MHPKPNFPSTPPIKICPCGLEIDKPGASNTRTRILVVVGTTSSTIACFNRIYLCGSHCNGSMRKDFLGFLVFSTIYVLNTVVKL